MTGFLPSDLSGYQVEMLGVGPMSKYASDLSILFKLFVGPENSNRLRLDEPVDLSAIRFYSMKSLRNKFTSLPLDTDVLNAFESVITIFNLFNYDFRRLSTLKQN
jgi:hypothetical protein